MEKVRIKMISFEMNGFLEEYEYLFVKTCAKMNSGDGYETQ